MKNRNILGLFLLTALTLSSCKKTKKTVVKKATKSYTIDAKTTTINWIAYKTTDKVPVKGKFTKITLNQEKAATPIEALNSVKFSIPVASIFTKDTIRDAKLVKFFFEKMINTNNITGSFDLKNDNTGSLLLTMNGITKQLPVTFVIKDQLVTIDGTLNLDNWQAQAALSALNIACKDLHTGKDGISKTWSEVKIEATTYLKVE
ncbi:YceI family protein [Lutibacter sp.]|uniref:YceI family protein n=1 Tax=Lutibacter sp. TaxID=1925666 RepID=UPI0025C55FB0|nr:YceI family protein [Lutibacter sp.]MCF6182460.1 YceI family protein [Lutibacter sp.]